ncbi:hypothetical protein B0H14DRAFT_3865275 [Mycena olivaceomarginata]|nr:hypothetical protein B0H14DRAFT_3865275 [Mycena olivaceomarginata]
MLLVLLSLSTGRRLQCRACSPLAALPTRPPQLREVTLPATKSSYATFSVPGALPRNMWVLRGQPARLLLIEHVVYTLPAFDPPSVTLWHAFGGMRRPSSLSLPPLIPSLKLQTNETRVRLDLLNLLKPVVAPTKCTLLTGDLFVPRSHGIHPARTTPAQPSAATVTALKPVLLVCDPNPGSLSFSLIFIYCSYEKEEKPNLPKYRRSNVFVYDS